MMAKKVWVGDKRSKLEHLLREGYPIRKIAELMGISNTSIYKELQDVLTEEEYENKQYLKYTAEDGWEKALQRMKGEL